MNQIIFLLLYFLCATAEAKFILSGSEIYSQYENKDLKIPTSTTRSFSYGLFQKYNNTTFSLLTNRLVEIENKVFVQKKSNNQFMILKSKYRVDTFNVGYQINNQIYGISLSNAKVRREFNSTETKQNVILYGINYSFPLKKDILLTFTLIAPNKKISLKGAGIFGINLIF